jgi:hypothetical protein
MTVDNGGFTHYSGGYTLPIFGYCPPNGVQRQITVGVTVEETVFSGTTPP